MKDYERYMNRQKMSDTGMARLMKLETERPEKGQRTAGKRQTLPRWAKVVGMAASLLLVVGLCALPALRWASQRLNPQPAEEELIFHEVDNVSFTTYRPIGWGMERAMEEQDAAAIFGCAPDDFIGLLEQVGLDQFDMQYYTVDMSNEGDYGYRFWMKGDYISPRVEEEIPPTVSCIPANDVWLEIYEGHSYLDEPDWAALESQTFHGHQVTATWNGSYEASAAFDVESGGKTYGVLYKACTYGDCDAKDLVTKMVAFLATEGLSIPNNELVFNEVNAIPNNGNAPEGLHQRSMNEADMAMILCGSEESWGSQCAELGWSEYNVYGWSTPAGRDPETNYAVNYFRFEGIHQSGNVNSFQLALMPNMTDFAAYTAQNVPNWDALEVSTVNGLPVTAAIYFDQASRRYYTAATFVVEDVVCDYGVFFQAAVKTEAEAKDLVTRAVNYLTRGVFTEMYHSFGGFVMDYEELPQVSQERPGMTVGQSRPLSREEINWVCPSLAEDRENAWSGWAYFYPDGSLGSITLSGYVKSGPYVEPDHATALRHVTIVMGKEEETFRNNYVDGRYLGIETEGPWGNKLRGYWWHDPDFIWGSDADDLGADVFVCQIDPNLGWVAEVITSQRDATQEEGRWLNIDWVTRVVDNLWWKDDLTMETDGIFVRDYDSLDELRGAVDEKFLPYLPTADSLPDYDEFHGYWRRNSGEYESAEARWSKPWVNTATYSRFSYSGDVDVKWPITAMGLPQVTDINDRESYDFREHPGLVMPEETMDYTGGELYEQLRQPTFRASDASLDLIESRIYWSDEYNSECRFQLLHDNNVLVNYMFHGMTAEEIWKVVQDTIPGARVKATGGYVMEAEKELLAPSISFDGENYTFTQSLLSSHFCHGDYTVENGRVTVRCDSHHYVFDIVDDDTLRFVAAESSTPVHYKTGLSPEVTDGAVFRWRDVNEKSETTWGPVDPALQPAVDPPLREPLLR